LLKHALRVRVSLKGKEHPSTLDCMDCLAYNYSSQGKDAEALSVYETTLTRQRISCAMKLSSISSDDDVDMVRTLLNLASLYTTAGQYAKADVILKHCLPMVEAFD